MARFRRIECSVWENDDFIELPKGAQTLFFYVLTNPSRNEAGLYRFSKKTALWKTNCIEEDFKNLVASSLVEWDEANDLIWIRSALDPRYFKPNPNIWVSIKNDLKNLWPHPFAKELLQRYTASYEELKGFKPSETL